MKKVAWIAMVCLCAVSVAQAGVTVEVGPGVDVGAGLTSYTVNLVADSPTDWVAGFDGGFFGAMNQIQAGGFLPTPTLTSAGFLTPTEKSQDSHFLFLDTDLLSETAPAEDTVSLTGVFSINPGVRAESISLAQIVLADGETVELVGAVGTVGEELLDVSTTIPEPATMILLGVGAMAMIKRRRK
jgi:hypothetical protein